MTSGSRPPRDHEGDFFGFSESDPELLKSGRIPDPQPGHTPLFAWLARVLTRVEERLRARGGKGFRAAIKAGWALVAALGILLLLGPIVNKPLDFEDIIDSAKVEEVDWIARDARVDYSIDRDPERMFVAEVSEAFTAAFVNGPESSVERVIVTEFEGHDVEFELETATIDGAPADVAVTKRATTTELRLRPASGQKFEGEQEIAVSYRLHHLIAEDVDEASGKAVDRWSWPLFAPTWPQGTRGLEVSLTLAPELDEALIRTPKAYLGWLLFGASAWLTPEDESGAGVTYSFSNDQTFPPNPDFWVILNFERGTFELPPKTPLFWVQTYGPLVPLALLGVIAVLALAARRVVWADSVGEPWYKPRSDPPDNVSPMLAAQLLRRARHAELTAAISDPPRRAREAAKTTWLREAARAGRRAGRLGNLPTSWSSGIRWAAAGRAVERKLRWAPEGYVRDTFLYAPVALTLVQWGLLRQLSHQVVLSVVWWPAAFVLLSTALAAVAFLAALNPRPLTREGAIVVQDLKGINAYARATRLLERGPLEDRLLPYAALFVSPRRAGDAVTELAAQESGDRRIAEGWRTERFLGLTAVLAVITAAGLLAGSIVLATKPVPYPNGIRMLTQDSELPGTNYTQTRGFEIDAELSRTEDLEARIEVVERHTVEFEPDAPLVPQFAREWPANRLGQDLGISIEAVRIDGEDTPFREVDAPWSRAAVTTFAEPLVGTHEIEVEYSLGHPAVDAEPTMASDRDAERTGGEVEQVRWVALYDFWEESYSVDPSDWYGEKAPVRPARVTLAIEPGLAAEAVRGGWIDSTRASDDPVDLPAEDGDGYRPWRYEIGWYPGDGQERREAMMGAERTRDDGWLVKEIALDQADEASGGDAALGKHETELTDDLGAVIDFPVGTFAKIDGGAAERYAADQRRPYSLVLWSAGIVAALGIATAWTARRSRARPSASLKAIAFIALPLLALAQSVVFSWAILGMAGTDGRGPVAMVLGALMLVAVGAAAWIVVRRIVRQAVHPNEQEPPPADAAKRQKSSGRKPAKGRE